MWRFVLKLCVFGNSTLLFKPVYFLELEIFWQISDCLSKKFFWDLAEPIVLIQKTQKSEKHRKYALNIAYRCKFLLKLDVLRNPHSSSYQYISWSWKFFGKSQIVCQRNFSEISQSPSYLFKKHKSLKNVEIML